MTHTELLVKSNKIDTSEQAAAEPGELNSTSQEMSLARTLGAKVCASVQELWELYPDRRSGSTTHVGRRIVEVEGVAMRDYEQHYLEETIVRSRVYNAARKSEFPPQETVSVYIKTEEGEELITVDPMGDADVRYRDNSDEPEAWFSMPYQRAENVVAELSHRAVIAAVRHGARTPEEKAAANEHATALLGQRFPLLVKREAPIE